MTSVARRIFKWGKQWSIQIDGRKTRSGDGGGNRAHGLRRDLGSGGHLESSRYIDGLFAAAWRNSAAWTLSWRMLVLNWSVSPFSISPKRILIVYLGSTPRAPSLLFKKPLSISRTMAALSTSGQATQLSHCRGAVCTAGAKSLPFLVEVLAKEIGHRGVALNSILPTAIEGAGVYGDGVQPEFREFIK
jgi:hypothetical protein